MLRALRYIASAALLLVVATDAALAQTILSRSALDSLVRPALSDRAEGTIRADSRTIDVGTISDSELVVVEFTLRNNHDEPVTLTELRASCSCLHILSSQATIAAGGSYVLSAEFNPRGRSGVFSYDINIYTSLDSASPTERLTLKGEIERTDPFTHLPYAIGALRLSRTSVTLEDVTATATRRERIAVANSGTTPVRVSARTTVEGLRLRCEPEELAAGSEGDIVIEYRPTKEPTTDIETMVILDGVEVSATARIIRITLKR